MDKNKFNIGFCAVVMIVLLRIGIGWHFFYEGLHKFDPAHEFSSKGFLGVAKGPTADLFFAMLPDLDGKKRLVVEEVTYKNAAGKDVKVKTFPAYENAFIAYKAQFDAKYGKRLEDGRKAEVERVYGQYIASLREYAAEHETAVRQYLNSLWRFEEEEGKHVVDVAHVQERRWNGMMAYRAEAGKWIGDLDKMGADMADALMTLYNPAIAGDSQLVTRPEKAWVPNPLAKSQIGLLDWAVSIGLTAIGLCMMLGLCNRLACLGGVVFLLNVWLVQFPFPGFYPELPDMIGHFMGVSKDFIELLAMLALAAMPAGRWGGLDYFLYYWCGGQKLAQRFGLEEGCCCGKKETGRKDEEKKA